ncbi:MAG TPA: polysaccharide deacetylase family protein [Candidatus Saccharimonadales bacterium]|nr:polysaccharide deacetylase family protein [Candidatus Saccharimonadales bacterium]
MLNCRNLLAAVAASLLVLPALGSALPVRAADNLIANPSVELATTNPNQPDSWQTGYLWGDLDASYQYLNTGYQSQHSLKITVSRFVSGDAKWFFDPFAVTPNQAYRFTDSYQASIATQVVAAVTKTDNSTQYIGLKDAPATSAWASYSDTFVAPAAAASVTVYHLINAVGSLTTDNFSLSAVSSTFNRGMVSLTFDDGWASQASAGAPILNQFNDKATFYIITGVVGHAADGYMTLNQAKALAQAGQEIGSHTVTHPDLTTLSLKRLDQELSQSLNYLKTKVTPVVADFAYPYGAYNAVTTREVKKYYRSARTSDVGLNTKTGFDPYRIQSEYVTPQTTLADFQGWLDQAKNQNAWLVVMYHQVDNSGSAYSVTPALLTAQLQALQNSGLAVKTVAQALTELQAQL